MNMKKNEKGNNENRSFAATRPCFIVTPYTHTPPPKNTPTPTLQNWESHEYNLESESRSDLDDLDDLTPVDDHVLNNPSNILASAYSRDASQNPVAAAATKSASNEQRNHSSTPEFLESGFDLEKNKTEIRERQKMLEAEQKNENHKAGSHRDRNLNACECNGVRRTLKDVGQNIGPKRQKAKAPQGGRDSELADENVDCGESPWLWYRDAVWGCEEFDWRMYERSTNMVESVGVNGKITYRQGGDENQEVRNLDVTLFGANFGVSWRHPSGPHPAYVVVVYPPQGMAGGASKRGPDCGPCADDDECLCATAPIFRRQLEGQDTKVSIPASEFDPGNSYVIEVATLQDDESLGSALVIMETFAV